MVKPDYYEISYSINPWMKINKNSIKQKAVNQWGNLRKTIESLGWKVDTISAQEKLPDMVFTANAGLIYKNRAVVSNFKHKERKPEAKFFEAYLKNNYEVLKLSSMNYFEGSGDALFAGDVLFAGYGFRSKRNSYWQIEEFLELKQIIFCKLIDPYFYHLDTCFCPLNNNKAIFYKKAFDDNSIEEMEGQLELFDIPQKEAKKFACNAVVLDKNVIIPSGCPQTELILQKLGFKVYSCNISEYIKSGGGGRCLTLKL
jgi:N-dimethylarginine dimethylaminohydrolase